MSFKDSKIAAAANSAMTLSAELAVDTEEYTLCTDGRYEVYTKYQDNAYSTVDNLKILPLMLHRLISCRKKTASICHLGFQDIGMVWILWICSSR